ncbi:MAG: extracellular solute-binding protein [Actinomycetota bacterium]|nr:extracellular solute-binding protein [Actinomycetota bacterium]
MTHPRVRSGGRARRLLAISAALALSGTLLAGCGSSGKPVLTWYINPDNGGQDAVAKNCSTSAYTIATQVLPQDAGQQRIQLARRLAASDSGIDLMSIDPPYTAEFANAGYLAKIPQALQDKLKQQSFAGAAKAATWNGQLAVAPFWSNVQVLWYRKSFAKKAGVDMTKPVTWNQIIDAASKGGGTVAVQSNKYEGYSVWINALVSGAGGDLISQASKGDNAKVDVNSAAGKTAAAIVQKLAQSKAAPADMSVAQEGQAQTVFGSPKGAFLVNWTYIWTAFDTAQPAVKKDLGYAPYPESVQGQKSRPPYGGIGIGVSKYSTHVNEAMQALECMTNAKNQGINAELTGNMPASAAGYQDPKLHKIYGEPLLKLFQDSLNNAAPRSVTPYWSDISGALQSTWHPPSSVGPNTPAQSAKFIEDVLKQRKLL